MVNSLRLTRSTFSGVTEPISVGTLLVKNLLLSLCIGCFRAEMCSNQVLRCLVLIRWSGLGLVMTLMMEVTAGEMDNHKEELKEMSLSRLSLRDSEREELRKGLEPVISV